PSTHRYRLRRDTAAGDSGPDRRPCAHRSTRSRAPPCRSTPYPWVPEPSRSSLHLVCPPPGHQSPIRSSRVLTASYYIATFGGITMTPEAIWSTHSLVLFPLLPENR